MPALGLKSVFLLSLSPVPDRASAPADRVTRAIRPDAAAMLEGCVPWPSDLAALYRASGLWEGLTIFEMVERSAARAPQKTAVGHDGRRLTYAELVATSAQLAVGFHALGLRPLDRVVVQLPNGLDFVFVYLALTRIGAIPVMALRAHRQAEIRHFIQASGAVAYVVADIVGTFDYREMAAEIQAEFPGLRQVVVAGKPHAGQIALQPLFESRSGDPEPMSATALPRPDPADVATMLLSGGTTSMSKLIPRTHDDYVLNARLCAHAAGFDARTVLMAILPLGHNYNLASPGLLGAFYCGATVVVASSTDTDHVFSLLQRERVTVIAAVVPLISNWLDAGVPQRYDLSSLEVVQNGGARLPPELRARLRAELGCIPQEIYGTAEGLINITRRGAGDEELLNSSGAPVSELDEIRVVDEDHCDVADGEPGELVTRGPYTIRGYYEAPEKNAEAFMAGGWYRMGDIVRKRGRNVYAEGRRKDLINRGGEKINCDEIESLLFRHPKVKVVALVAMSDPLFGERACACVIPQPDATLTLEELVAFLREQRIASFKLPERLELMSEFPVSPVGKILKRQLREIVEGRPVAGPGKVTIG